MGRAARPGLSLENDMTDGYAALGFAKGMAEGLSSKYYLTAVVEYAYGLMSDEFYDQMMLSAQNDGGSLNHVYEPGNAGVRGMELWQNKLYGRGEKREASFEWKQSVMPILDPITRSEDEDDPMSKVPDEVIAKLSDKKYVFRMRAPIMEYGIRTTITPRPGTKRLFIPTFGIHHPWKSKKNGLGDAEHFRFEKVNVPDWNYSNPQEPSGSQGNVGQFTARFVGFWAGGGAAKLWNDSIQRGIEGGLDDWGQEMGKVVKGNRSTTKIAKISTFNDSKVAMEAGRNLAQAYIKGKAKSLAAAQRYIEKNGSFGGDVNY